AKPKNNTRILNFIFLYFQFAKIYFLIFQFLFAVEACKASIPQFFAAKSSSFLSMKFLRPALFQRKVHLADGCFPLKTLPVLPKKSSCNLASFQKNRYSRFQTHNRALQLRQDLPELPVCGFFLLRSKARRE